MNECRPNCDCLNICGDDPDVAKGLVEPCDHYKKKLAEPRITNVRRKRGSDSEIVISFNKPIDTIELERIIRQSMNRAFHLQ